MYGPRFVFKIGGTAWFLCPNDRDRILLSESVCNAPRTHSVLCEVHCTTTDFIKSVISLGLYKNGNVRAIVIIYRKRLKEKKINKNNYSQAHVTSHSNFTSCYDNSATVKNLYKGKEVKEAGFN